jgi:hypothetical protein
VAEKKLVKIRVIRGKEEKKGEFVIIRVIRGREEISENSCNSWQRRKKVEGLGRTEPCFTTCLRIT